ncbi:MAG TPA: CUAEP/CCAEP-tail radical SAM protein [Acidimicrobiia bacterium]
MRMLLVSTYELGHQPLGVAVPAAALRARGHELRCTDLSIEPWDPALGEWAEMVACSVPMHTAARLARQLALTIEKPLCCYGLYASMCTDVADKVIAGEYVDALVAWVDGDDPRGSTTPLGREAAARGAPLPARDLLPTLDRYAHLSIGGEERLAGAVEASHGCAHRCRHCPVPVVYDGRIRIVDADAVLADIAQQVEAGARHITFGDPDFFNGVHHSLRVVRAMHEQFPDVTFDCTVKVEHILRHAEVWPEMAASGCLFVVSAFESVDDAILERLDKGHTALDAARATTLLRGHGIEIRPSFLPFTPWTTVDGFRALLDFVAEHDLVGNVDPVQYSIRLLLPRGSLLLDHPDIAPYLGPWDAARLTYEWIVADPAVDELQRDITALVERETDADTSIAEIYRAVRAAAGAPPIALGTIADPPRLTESWFCCAEPTEAQLAPLTTWA